MSRGLVLVIEDDEWVSRLLQSAIREAGYEVVVCQTAKAGLDAAFSQSPDCIVCDVALPDQDGLAVARQVRTHTSRVSVTPILFLSELDDEQSRIEGFHVGADVYITKPFRVDEVVAQIDALVQMATRLRARRDSMISIPPGVGQTAIEGDLGQMSIATVLTVLEMERRTGMFEVVSKKRRAHLDIVSGSVIDGAVGGTSVSALTALRTMLGWNVGRFRFVPTPQRDVPPSHNIRSLGAFLIEALRLEDEATRAELELPPSRRRPNDVKIDGKMAAPALGGPASSPADFAPPSSRTPKNTDLLESELSDWEIPADIAPEARSRRDPRSLRQPLPAIPPPAIPAPANPPPVPPTVDRNPPAARVAMPPPPKVNVPRPPPPVPRPTPPRPNQKKPG